MNNNNISSKSSSSSSTTDLYYNLGILIILGSVIGLLLFLELIGYIHKETETFQGYVDNRTDQEKENDKIILDNNKSMPNILLKRDYRKFNREIHNSFDSGFIPYRLKMNNILSNVNEIDAVVFIKILKKIENIKIKYGYNFNINKKLKLTKAEIFTLFKLEFVALLNKLVLDNNNYDPKIKFDFYKLLNSFVLSNDYDKSEDDKVLIKKDEKEEDYEETYFDFNNNKLIFVIGRGMTQRTFTIFMSVTVKSNIPSIIARGSPVNSEVDVVIEFSKIGLLSMNNQSMLDIDKKKTYYDNEYESINDTVLDTKRLYGNNNLKRDEIDKYLKKVANEIWSDNQECFGYYNGQNIQLNDYKNELFCKSYHPEIDQVGIFDSKCQDDNECPFYKANKNYPNEFGKCNKTTGICEFPVGVRRVGFKYNMPDEPLCYNCPDSYPDNKCCDYQKTVDGLDSPDYVFNNDSSVRYRHRNSLNSKGLNKSVLN